MSVFVKTMDSLKTDDESAKATEKYINYMCERIEFNNSNINKELIALAERIAALEKK